MAPPTFLICHICGRQFGRASLLIHEKSCAKKFLASEAQKPSKERQPLPERSAALASFNTALFTGVVGTAPTGRGGNGSMIDAYNDMWSPR